MNTDDHILQLPEWGELKSRYLWDAVQISDKESQNTIQLLFRRLPLGFHIAYIPKVKVDPAFHSMLPEIHRVCKQKNAIFLKVEPDYWEEEQQNMDIPVGFVNSSYAIQPQRTIVIDLVADDDAILSRMKQKTRYNIRLSKKKGVVVRKTEDVSLFFELMVETGSRDAFGIHSHEYFNDAYKLFHPIGACEIFVAEYESKALAAIMVFKHGKRAWYFYGASSNEHRNLMPTYLLQWEGMRWAKSQGCTEYDLWGVPDADLATLENEFMERSDGLWGVYRFKRGFGGDLKRADGPWDKVYKPILYKLYDLYVNLKKS